MVTLKMYRHPRVIGRSVAPNCAGYPSALMDIQALRSPAKGDFVKKTVSAITTVVGAATLLMAGYVLLAALPDLRRYIKISTM
jgi:hypothetical protein